MSARKWDDETLSYAAGFLDGEGCFTSFGPYQKLVICAENTYKPVMIWLQSQFGGSLTETKPKKSHHRVTYRWAVVGRVAVELCQSITPFLMEKADQALLVIAIDQLKLRKGEGHHNRISPEIKDERVRLVGLLKEAKGRVLTH